ncbi:MAG: EI24 domain-containing protein [Bacteroidales bacterium]|jgi:CysZ protein|nr:EI24 domain-containing protein [Bacteroidales bacterium]MDD4215247.1 EI24 domain-containing protein [Bacteroidales bacterium]
MALFPNFRIGFNTYSDAHKLIIKHKLWGYVLLPAIINVSLLIILVFFGWHYFNQFTEWLQDVTGLSSTSSRFWKYLVVFFKWAIKIILYVILFFLYFSIYRYIVLMLISPVLAILSEKTDKLLTGINYPFRMKQFLTDIRRGILIAIRNLLIETSFTILFFFIAFIPIIRWLAPVFIFFITCYFYGFSMIDYSNERARMNIGESIRYMRKNRGMAISNGMVFYFVFFFIPVVGFIFAPAYSVIAATIAVNKAKKNISVPQKAPTIILP